MKLRIVAIPCSENPSGVCYIVERKSWLFGWVTYLTTYNYGGMEITEHFQTLEGVRRAVQVKRKATRPSTRVVEEFDL